MHEWGLAEAVAAAAAQAAGAAKIARVTDLHIRLGELQHIEAEVFDFALREILRAGDPRLLGARIHLETEPARLRCRACAREWSPEESPGALGPDAAEAIHMVPEVAHVFLRCPGCESPDFEVTKGRGIWLDRVEGDG